MLSFGKRNADKSKNFQNRTTFRWSYLQSKFYFIAPILNNSLCCKMAVKFLCLNIEKFWNNFWCSCTYIYYQNKKKVSGVYLGGSGMPLNNPIFRGLPDPLGRPLTHLIYFVNRYMYRNIRSCFTIFLSPNTKISQPFYNIDCYSV